MWTQTQGEHYVDIKAEMRVMGLQAKECQRPLANDQKLGERHGDLPYSQQKGPTLPISCFQISSLQKGNNKSLLFKPPSLKHFLGPPQEKGMAPHSSTLAWKIPWAEEPGRLQSLGSLRVGHNWTTSLSLFIFLHWRRKWQPTPVFLPGESQGRGSLVGCHLWGRTESDTTEAT